MDSQEDPQQECLSLLRAIGVDDAQLDIDGDGSAIEEAIDAVGRNGDELRETCKDGVPAHILVREPAQARGAGSCSVRVGPTLQMACSCSSTSMHLPCVGR